MPTAAPSSHLLFVERGKTISKLEFPSDLSGLTLIKHYPGGSGGVYELSDGDSNFMLKLSTTEHLKREILADTLYLRLGAPVPSFAVYEGVPANLLTAMEAASGHALRNNPLCRLSEKINGEQPSPINIEEIGLLLKQQFVLYAYLRNRDIAKFDNLILSNDSKVYCIDNGAFLATRALGRESTEDVNHVIELQTLRDPSFSPLGAEYFKSLTCDDIKQQKDALLIMQSTILNTALEINEKLSIDFFDEIYTQLVARLHSLVEDNFLDDFESQTLEVNKKPLKGSAAGIFSIAYVDGEPYVLLGKRNGTYQGHWCSLGGKISSDDESFQATAVREVLEESNGVLEYEKDEIRYLPFFDLAIGSPGSTHVYRMFLSPTQYCKASLMTEHLEAAVEHENNEYEQFAWVSLRSLLAGVDKDNDEIIVALLDETNLQTTLPQVIKLYPDMKRMLQDIRLQKALELYLEPPPILALRPEKLKIKLAETVSYRAALLKQLKENHSRQKVPSSTTTHQENTYTLSEKHLDLILNTSTSIPLEKKINLFFDQAALGNASDYDKDCRAQFLSAIKKEQDYQSQGYLTLYHAAPREVVILYDLFTALYQQLQCKPHSPFQQFRLSELPFQSYKTLAEFMAHFSRSGKINNYNEDYQDIALSTNIFAFGSHNNESSASYWLFTKNKPSRDTDIDKILATGLTNIGIDKPLRQLLLKRLKEILKNTASCGGTLYQIHLPKDDVDNYVYPAAHFGEEYKLNDEKISFTTLLDLIAANKINKEAIQKLQARIFVHPEAMQKAAVVAYPHHALSKAHEINYRTSIRDNANMLFVTLLQMQNEHAMFLKKPASSVIYQQKFAELTGKQKNADPLLLLKRLIESQQYVKIRYLLNSFPTLFSNEAIKIKLPVLINSVTKFIRVILYLDTKQCAAVCTALKDELTRLSLKDFLFILNSISPEQRTVVYETIKHHLPEMIHSGSDFSDVIQLLLADQRTAIYDATKANFIHFIQSSADFNLILRDLNPEQRETIFEEFKYKLPELINTGLDFSNILQYLSSKQRSTVFEIIRNKLPALSRSGVDVAYLLQYLDSNQRSIIFNSKNIWESVIRSSTEFADLLQYLTPEQTKTICEDMKEKLMDLLIQSKPHRATYIFASLLCPLSIEQRTIIYDVLKDKLASLIDSDSAIGNILQYLSPEQCTAFCISINDKLSNFIESNFSLARTLTTLTPDRLTIVCEVMKDRFQKLVYSSQCLAGVLPYLNSQQCVIFCKITNDKLPDIIKHPLDVIVILRSLHRQEEFIAVCNIMKDNFTKIITSNRKFAEVMRCLYQEKQTLFFEIMKGHLIHLMNSHKNRAAVFSYLSPQQKKDINQLLVFISHMHSNKHATIFASALMSDDYDNMRAQFTHLNQPKNRLRTFFSKKSATTQIIDELSHLEPYWIKKINTAFELGLSETKPFSQEDIKAALENYVDRMKSSSMLHPNRP